MARLGLPSAVLATVVLLVLALGVWLGSPAYTFTPGGNYLRAGLWFKPKVGPEILGAVAYRDGTWALLYYGRTRPPKGLIWDRKGFRIQ